MNRSHVPTPMQTLFGPSPLSDKGLLSNSSSFMSPVTRMHWPILMISLPLPIWVKKELHQIASLLVREPSCNARQGERWYTCSPFEKITSDLHLRVIEFLGQQAAQCYWHHKQHLNATSFELVHWVSISKAIGSFPQTFQKWLSKFGTRITQVYVLLVLSSSTMMFQSYWL